MMDPDQRRPMSSTVAWKAGHEGLDLSDGVSVAALAVRAVFDLSDRVVVDGHDVTRAIRTPAIYQAAAVVAQHPPVRAVLVERQRQYGLDGGLVMDGRDIGSIVFPDADVKVYLDASPEERARRRSHDAAHEAGRVIGTARVAEALEVRDHADRTRPASPLRVAPGAEYLDTTGLPIADVVDRILALAYARLTSGASS